MGVVVGNITIGTVVDVGSGVNVLRGVSVTVAVDGTASCVCVEADSAVWAM